MQTLPNPDRFYGTRFVCDAGHPAYVYGCADCARDRETLKAARMGENAQGNSVEGR